MIRRVRPLHLLAVLLGAGAVMPAGAAAQPADFPLPPADGSPLPADVVVRTGEGQAVYTDRAGRVLYGMDMRTVLRWSPDAAQYCTRDCRKTWEPLRAPKGSVPNIRFPADGLPRTAPGYVLPQAAPDWTIIAGPDGPQWVYKGWHMVYVRRGADSRSTVHDGADDRTWNTLKYIPPRPRLTVPPSVATRFIAGAYRLTDTDGRLLFTGPCTAPCRWAPFPAPLASAGVGEWSVERSGDTAQWAHRNQPVFVADHADPASLPAGAHPLQP
ncbi:hypothetical protein ACFOON_01095 [Novosphingobium piscinae]|uniref:Lipoprotein n=1 Tax=Novosphingobium piscinae TaxID=1507448 RepID=A0A7X1FVN4_9SPHN|nr:hypothetical protein [Novosphingobium piscinae]MBC2667823.1 hypothetical protein [Novosphingobium piscinae]